MSTRLALLGLLKNKPLYGYELKHIIEKHMGDWTNIAFGSIYFALNKLNKEGFVERMSEKKVGNRPSRNIYKITDKGKDEFLTLLRKTWENFERDYYSLDIALSFSSELPKDEVTGYINRRIGILNNILIHLKKHKNEQLNNKEVPTIAKAIFSHSEYHFKAELNWLKEILNDFKNDKY
jgi:DNA-binding PadR family transcriptional regulator